MVHGPKIGTRTYYVRTQQREAVALVRPHLGEPRMAPVPGLPA
jgi:hypothetical protein